MEKIEEALLPFALIGSETHDTSFTVRIVDKDGHEVGRVDQDNFRKVYELLLDIKAGEPIAFSPPKIQIPHQDPLKDILYWVALLWASIATALLITR